MNMEKVFSKVDEAIETIGNNPITAQTAQMLYYLMNVKKEAGEIRGMEKVGRAFQNGRIGAAFERIITCWVEYTDMKQKYHDSMDETSRRQMINSLRVLFSEMMNIVEELCSSAECEDEREIIDSYRRGIL